MHQTLGFTLMELMVSVAICTTVGSLGFVAVATATESAAAAEAHGRAQDEVRGVLRAVASEVALASTQSDDSLVPELQAAVVSQDGTRITFQAPADGSGMTWSQPITLAWVTEDINGNSLLDPGEDANEDGMLTRVLERRQDLNGDGDTTDGGERRPLAGAHNLSQVQFALNGTVLTLQVRADVMVSGRRTQPIAADATMRVYLLN